MQAHTAGKTIVKVVVAQGRLVTIVVESIDTMRRPDSAVPRLRPRALLALLCLSAGAAMRSPAGARALPSHIRSIGVPRFINATPMFDLEQALTARVRLEFIGRGRYKVVPDELEPDPRSASGLEHRRRVREERDADGLDVRRQRRAAAGERIAAPAEWHERQRRGGRGGGRRRMVSMI